MIITFLCSMHAGWWWWWCHGNGQYCAAKSQATRGQYDTSGQCSLIKLLMGKQVSTVYLPVLCTNESGFDSWSRHLYTFGFQSTCFCSFFSGCSGFPLAYKTGPKRSKIWPGGPPGKQWYTLSEAFLCKYGLFIPCF